jgi:hypothetical protein
VDPTVAGALIGFGGGAAISLATQYVGLKREDKQLRHAERLQVDAEARVVLDEALATAYEAREKLVDYTNALIDYELALEDQPGEAGAEDVAFERRDATEPLLGRLRWALGRLSIRFGAYNPVTGAYLDIVKNYMEAYGIAAGFHTSLPSSQLGNEPENPHEYTVSRLKARDLTIVHKITDFAERAHAWAARD